MSEDRYNEFCKMVKATFNKKVYQGFLREVRGKRKTEGVLLAALRRAKTDAGPNAAKKLGFFKRIGG